MRINVAMVMMVVPTDTEVTFGGKVLYNRTHVWLSGTWKELLL